MGTASGDRDTFQHLLPLPDLHWTEYPPRLLSPSPKPSVIATACCPCLRESTLSRNDIFQRGRKKQRKALLLRLFYQLFSTHSNIASAAVPFFLSFVRCYRYTRNAHVCIYSFHHCFPTFSFLYPMHNRTAALVHSSICRSLLQSWPTYISRLTRPSRIASQPASPLPGGP